MSLFPGKPWKKWKKLRVTLATPCRVIRTKKKVKKKNYGKVSMGVVRTTYFIDEHGIIVKANDKVKAADDPGKMLQELSR